MKRGRATTERSPLYSGAMQIAVLTFDGFNELDSLVVAHLLNRLSGEGWQAFITAATDRVVSRNGVAVEAQQTLEFAAEADAVVFGSGIRTEAIAADQSVMSRIRLDPARQLIASQCSGALMLAKRGLLPTMRATTDLVTRPALARAGVEVVDGAFHAEGNVATAGGCLASQYIAAWMIGRRLGLEAAARVIHYVAPVGEKEDYVARALAAVRPFVEEMPKKNVA